MNHLATIDDQGPIRYDWPGIRLMYVGGAGTTDIARAMTKDFPDQFDRVRAAIAQRAHREEWMETRDAAEKLTESRPEGSKNNKSIAERGLSQNVIPIAQNLLSARKQSYLERTTVFIDKASKRLEERNVETLEDVALAAKLFEPVHAIAKDVHGLNAKEGTHALQVNFMSDFAGVTPSKVILSAQESSNCNDNK